MRSSRSISHIILELANRQHGVLSRRQLLAKGIPAKTISDRIANSSLFPVYPGVYLAGRPQLTRDGALLASLLAAGDGAVLGARSAAALWGFLDHQSPVEVFRIRGGRNQRARIRVDGERWWPYLLIRQPRELPAIDLGVKRGLTLTSPARTLRDLAMGLQEEKFRWAFMEADRLGLLSDPSLIACADQTQGRKGGAMFRQMVYRRIPNIDQAESLLEAIVLDLNQSGRIPVPEVNRKTHGYRPDFRWSRHRVIVEADGYEFHRGQEAFENDAFRANRLRADGWTVLRFTWRMVTEKPDDVAEMIRSTLSNANPAKK